MQVGKEKLLGMFEKMVQIRYYEETMTAEMLDSRPLEKFVIPQVANIVLATQELMLKTLLLLAAL
jgi:hypothetical protein